MTKQGPAVDEVSERRRADAFQSTAWVAATVVVTAALLVQWVTAGGFPAPLLESASRVGSHAVLVAPFVAVGLLRSPDLRRALRLLGPVGGLYLLYEVALRSDLPVFDEASWNFGGKIVAVAALLLLLRGMTFGRPADVGVT
ncbi:MAG: hypothetical protein ACRCYR_08245, partial [Phycicoccus sp.]